MPPYGKYRIAHPRMVVALCRIGHSMSSSLEDRIRLLTDRAIAAKTQSELDAILPELKAAIRDHIRYVRAIAVETIPEAFGRAQDGSLIECQRLSIPGGRNTMANEWEKLYRAAIIETDRSKLEARIEAAEFTMHARLHKFSLSHGGMLEGKPSYRGGDK